MAASSRQKVWSLSRRRGSLCGDCLASSILAIEVTARSGVAQIAVPGISILGLAPSQGSVRP